MLRLALPALCCAALLSYSSGVERRPRALHAVRASAIDQAWAAPRHAAEEGAPATVGEAEPDELESEPPPPDEEGPPEPSVLRQHDVRDLVARGYTIEQISRWVGCEHAGARVTELVNVLEVIAPAGTQLEIERLLDENRWSGPRVLQFYPVADLVCTEDELATLRANREAYVPDTARGRADPFEVDSLIEILDVTIGYGRAEIRAKNRVLVVRAQPAVQATIARLLADLRLAAPRKPPWTRADASD